MLVCGNNQGALKWAESKEHRRTKHIPSGFCAMSSRMGVSRWNMSWRVITWLTLTKTLFRQRFKCLRSWWDWLCAINLSGSVDKRVLSCAIVSWSSFALSASRYHGDGKHSNSFKEFHSLFSNLSDSNFPLSTFLKSFCIIFSPNKDVFLLLIVYWIINRNFKTNFIIKRCNCANNLE